MTGQKSRTATMLLTFLYFAAGSQFTSAQDAPQTSSEKTTTGAPSEAQAAKTTPKLPPGSMVLNAPDKWIIDVPPADRVCPPTRTAFADASRSVSKVGSRLFKHEINGGWHRAGSGSAHASKILHVGMDFGLLRVGEPVYAIANGVVRMSAGPVKQSSKSRRKRSGSKKSDPTKFNISSGEAMTWGNIVVIEHHFPKEGYCTSVYGHLDTNRLVDAGETVVAGQMIGRIGAKNPYINGGYIPHLHFGIREGRMGEENGIFRVKPIDGKFFALRMTSIDEDKIIVELDRSEPIQPPPGIVAPQNTAPVTEKQEYPARLLWTMNRHGFNIAGHTTDAKPWVHPLSFLRAHGALSRPATFQSARRRSKKKSSK